MVVRQLYIHDRQPLIFVRQPLLSAVLVLCAFLRVIIHPSLPRFCLIVFKISQVRPYCP